MGLPKNGKSRRVDLTPMVVDALRRLRRTGKVLSLEGFIFRNANENGPGHETLNKALQKVAPRKIRIHSLRHSYATLRVSKGDNIVDVSN